VHLNDVGEKVESEFTDSFLFDLVPFGLAGLHGLFMIVCIVERHFKSRMAIAMCVITWIAVVSFLIAVVVTLEDVLDYVDATDPTIKLGMQAIMTAGSASNWRLTALPIFIVGSIFALLHLIIYIDPKRSKWFQRDDEFTYTMTYRKENGETVHEDMALFDAKGNPISPRTLKDGESLSPPTAARRYEESRLLGEQSTDLDQFFDTVEGYGKRGGRAVGGTYSQGRAAVAGGGSTMTRD
jgi:hypothetical protein